jgi:regulator of protease activity HflC (stomatin/prohibitin superfamily)
METILLIALFLFIGAFSFVLTEQNTVKITQIFGKYRKTTRAGFSLRVPFFERVAGILSLRIQELSEVVGVKSKDNAFLSVPVKVQYKVIKGQEKDAFYILEDAGQQISSYIVNTVRSTASSMTMDEIFQSKDKFESDVEETLNEKFNSFGFKIENVLVDDPQPSQSVQEAFNEVISSERKKEAAKNYAEAKRIELVGEAQAQAESLELTAQAYVKQRQIIANGIKDIVPESDLIPFLERIDWRDAIRDASSNQGSLIIVPANMDLGGDIAKIKALTK